MSASYSIATPYYGLCHPSVCVLWTDCSGWVFVLGVWISFLSGGLSQGTEGLSHRGGSSLALLCKTLYIDLHEQRPQIHEGYRRKISQARESMLHTACDVVVLRDPSCTSIYSELLRKLVCVRSLTRENDRLNSSAPCGFTSGSFQSFASMSFTHNLHKWIACPCDSQPLEIPSFDCLVDPRGEADTCNSWQEALSIDVQGKFGLSSRPDPMNIYPRKEFAEATVKAGLHVRHTSISIAQP